MADGGHFVSGVASLGTSQPACKRGDPMNNCCSFTRQPPSSQPATLSDRLQVPNASVRLYLATRRGRSAPASQRAAAPSLHAAPSVCSGSS